MIDFVLTSQENQDTARRKSLMDFADLFIRFGDIVFRSALVKVYGYRELACVYVDHWRWPVEKSLVFCKVGHT